MPDDLIQVLTRFHREVVMPDVRDVVDSAVGALRNEMLSRFEAIYELLDRVQPEQARTRR